ncbi:efflux RND transporter periplasmic adaptor subunit [Marinigracilibium pacificum]|uniref:HlyD family efflux transporter periplasmic adaptor subunit n=1 Tax=Marinigracilibium pacificum TaxID=2729599 RepID=A0A848J6G6_9BACT|nr:HlyD family efflux transporter periplasmic adaptor subunit [Marinigracilibium pacificum]NMM50110.1 HlyD family efflux transporter periplasmic adaptor subunit [Marinigracilibium pacificum]
MDRKIEKKQWTWKKISGVAVATLLVGFLAYQLILGDNRSSLNVESERITIAEVKRDKFQEFIPVNGNVAPGEVYYLDAIEGGIINDVIRESGAMVKEGDTILILSNSNLQLDVMQRETQLYEQINNLRQTRLLLDQNDLSQRAQLAEIDYQINILQPQFERSKKLYKEKLISEQEYEQIDEQLKYNKNRRKLTYRSYRNDSIARAIQMNQLYQSEQRMLRSLDAVGKILDNLIITAPESGQLSAPQLEVGQSVGSGMRLGQVDVMGNYKVRVGIDELYLPRIDIGQRGTFTFAGKDYSLEISKIYPNITDGKFQVDMIFNGEIPNGIRRGQTLRIRLELGNLEEALLLPTGGFFNDTGGRWIYVLNSDETKAYKKEISIGRRNPDYYEVLSGLEPGDRVVISGYDNFGDNEVLNLK